MKRLIAGTVAALLGCCVAALAITNGTIDTVHTYVGAGIVPNVFGLTGFTGGDGFIACSGTLVAPRVLLTAGHCLFNLTNFISLDQLVVTFDATNIFPPPPDSLKVSSLAVMPGFQITTSETPDINDVGVIILAQPIHNITPARLAPVGLLDTFPALSKATVSLLGYGLNEQLVLTGNRLITTSGITNLSDTWLKLSGTPGTFCTFDDGGPTLLVDGPTEYQVGLHSSTTQNTGHGSVVDGCGSHGYDTRVDTLAVQSFVQAQIAANP